MVLSIDDPIPNKLLDTIIEVEGITNANPVTL
jgi:D-3-phosphoglycerate dehydrogenase